MDQIIISLKNWAKFTIIATICISAALSACASNNASATPKDVPIIINPQRVIIKWDINELSGFLSGGFTPAIIDNSLIFATSSDGDIYKIDATDGSIIKKYHTKHILSSGIALAANKLFVTTKDAKLLAIDEFSGDILWETPLATLSIEPPQAINNTVIVKTIDASIIAYDATANNPIKINWLYQQPVNPLSLRSHNTMTIVPPDMLLSGQPGGRLMLLNANTGSPIWENYIALPTGATDLDKLTDIAMRPVLVDKQICLASYNGKIGCIDALSSNIIWSRTFSSTSGVAIADNTLYATSSDGVVYAFDKNNGNKLWSNDILQYRSLSAPQLLINNIIIIDSDGYINLFAKSNGKLVARTSSALRGLIIAPWSNGEKVIVQSQNGHLMTIMQ